MTRGSWRGSRMVLSWSMSDDASGPFTGIACLALHSGRSLAIDSMPPSHRHLAPRSAEDVRQAAARRFRACPAHLPLCQRLSRVGELQGRSRSGSAWKLNNSAQTTRNVSKPHPAVPHQHQLPVCVLCFGGDIDSCPASFHVESVQKINVSNLC